MSNTIYCTYLTVYRGDKLPPLYIGSTSVQKIEDGYHGSVSSKKYKQIWITELKENPHLFETKILTTHSTREEALEEEMRYQIEHNVVRSQQYINMAVANGKLMNIGHSPEVRKKMSESKKGKKIKPFTEEHRKKMSEAQKKRFTNPEQIKLLSEQRKGKKKNRLKLNEEHKKKLSESMIGKMKSEETKKKMSESAKKRWKDNRNKV